MYFDLNKAGFRPGGGIDEFLEYSYDQLEKFWDRMNETQAADNRAISQAKSK